MLGHAHPSKGPETSDLVGLLLTPMKTSEADHLASGAWVSLCKAERQQMLCGKAAVRSEVVNAGA